MIRPPEGKSKVSIGSWVTWPSKDFTMISPADTGAGIEFIKCDCSDFQRKGWCPHLYELYKSEQDVLVLGRPFYVVINQQADKWLCVPVKITPCDDSVFCQVILYWGAVTFDSTSSKVRARGSAVIGFINPTLDHSQGRLYIRSLVLEYLLAVPYIRDLRCEAQTHPTISTGFKNVTFRDIYNRLDTGVCVECDESMFLPEV